MLAKQLLVEFPTGKRIVYPSLASFIKEFSCNQSAVIKAMKAGLLYKKIKLSYLGQGEIKNDSQYFIESSLGYEVRLTDFTGDNEILLRIFNLVAQNKAVIGEQWFALLTALQLYLNFLNLDNVDIGD